MKTISILIALAATAFAQTAEIDALTARRNEAVARIDATYKIELAKLKDKYVKAGNLEAANAVVKLMETPAPAGNFAGTSWAFSQPGVNLGIVTLNPNGSVQGEKVIAGVKWESPNEDTIIWIFPNSAHVVYRFTESSRSVAVGPWPDGTDPRTLTRVSRGSASHVSSHASTPSNSSRDKSVAPFGERQH